ncbi:DUF2237 family protein [Salinarchaeum laminariae]|uniref:DUF2237 family protein n=1 Tax=Salinarchaeum laminariae TaxID=869888 RepID=UPI0020BF23F1|nr:DUF2237 domain-containing protein [Salinarchaeum laminariae]
MSDSEDLNVHDEPLTPCSLDPETGYERDGYCREVLADAGRHEICAVMTEEFLDYTAAQGNDLRSAQPALNFPGLDPGDRWCVCVPRWLEAEEADCAPPIVPEATAKAVLTHVSRDTIEAYAHEEG